MRKILLSAAVVFAFSCCLVSCGKKSNMDKIREAQELYKEGLIEGLNDNFEKGTKLIEKHNAIKKEIDYNSLTEEEKMEYGREYTKEFVDEVVNNN